MDDVQWLRSRGEVVEQQFMFVVDSAARDRTAYPTPSDYIVSLPMPLRNVFAVDLVDATIPRTEYSIEKTSNTLLYAPSHDHVSADDARAAGRCVTVRIPPGDYTAPLLVDTLNAAFEEAALGFAAAPHAPIVVEPVSDPIELTNRLRFVRSDPFAVFMDASSIRGALGFGAPAHAPGAATAYDGQPRYATTNLTRNDVFQSVPVAARAPTPAYVGPVAVELPGYEVLLQAGGTVSQTFTCATSGIPSRISVRGGTATQTSIAVQVQDVAGGVTIASGVVAAVPGATLWTGVMAPIPGTGATTILEGQVYAIELTPAAALTVYRAERFSDDAAAAIAVDGVFVTATDAVCADLEVTIARHGIEAPGQLNLTGERFLLVRSPDIEQHIHRNLANAFDRMAPGMGMCKLGGFGFREERFNFLAYETRRFHPIGKLQGMRIRLEKRDGELYDSHGIDHMLLFVVKMFAAGAPTAAPAPSTLYPKYTPDPRKALIDKLERERNL